MRRVCARCGANFEGRSSRATYCSARCRVAAHEARKRGEVSTGSLPAEVEAELRGSVDGVRAATLSALERGGVTATPAGQVALVLAARIDSPADSDSGSALAAAVREHRSALADALAQSVVVVAGDPIDELAERRAGRSA